MQLSDYLALFPGASREKSRFMALAEAALSQVLDLQNLVAQIRAGYSVWSAVGAQLDAVAKAVGLRRESGIETDEAFRQYLLAKLCLWGWDGSNEGVPAALAAQLGVTVFDNGNGTVSVSPAGTSAELVPVPETGTRGRPLLFRVRPELRDCPRRYIFIHIHVLFGSADYDLFLGM